MKRHVLLVLALAALLPAACKREKKEPAPAAKVTVRLVLDGKEVGRFEPPVTPRPLAELLPIGSAPYAEWQRLQADASAGRFLDISTPVRSYPDVEVRVYSDRGKAAIGLFRPVKPDLPESMAKIARQPAVSLNDVHEIRVRIAPPAPEDEAVVESAEMTALPVLVGGVEKPITAETLQKIGLKYGPTQQARGWPLADALTPAVAPAKIQSVRIEGWKGMYEDIPAEELSRKDVWLLLKANKKGEYVFRRWEKAQTEPVAEVRGVRMVRVTLKEGASP